MRSISARDWARVGLRLGLGGDWAVDRFRELRAILPSALDAALIELPPSAVERGRVIVNRINRHTETLPDL